MRHRMLAYLFLIAMASPAIVYSSEPLIASGCSVSNVGYLNDLAREYERRNSGVTIQVRGGGSLLGISELKSEKTDFAASCKSKGPADPAEFEFIPIAWDALVFIANKSNTAENITIKNVRNIYTGELSNWKDLGGPDIPVTSFISTAAGMGGVGEALDKYVMDGRKFTRQANSVVTASSVAIWEQMVEKTPGGFASTGFASARKRDVKMLKLNGVAPTKENIISGKYPLKRNLYIVINKKDVNPEVKKFIEFALSKEGQRFISRLGIPSRSDIK